MTEVVIWKRVRQRFSNFWTQDPFYTWKITEDPTDFLFILYHRLNICFPNSYVETHVMVFGGGTSGSWLDHECCALMNGISTLMRDPRELPHPFLPWEDTVRRQLSTNQGAGAQQTLNQLDIVSLSLRFGRFGADTCQDSQEQRIPRALNPNIASHLVKTMNFKKSGKCREGNVSGAWSTVSRLC